MSVLATLRRRWLTGLVVFGLVTLLVGLLAQRAPQPTIVDDPKATVTENFNVTWRMQPQQGDVEKQYPAVALASTLTGTWLAAINDDDVRAEVLRSAGVEMDEAEARTALVASQPPLVLGIRLETRGVPQDDARRIITAWEPVATRVLDGVIPRVDGQPIVSMVPMTAFAPTPVEKPATTTPAAPKAAVKTIGWPLALLLGLIAGLVAMFVHDALDRRVTSPRQLTELGEGVRQLPALALPHGTTAASGAALESVRRLRAAVLAGDSDVTLLVSPDRAGTSDAAATALARSLSASGRSTLLVARGATTSAATTTAAPGAAAGTALETVERDGELSIVRLPEGEGADDAVAGPRVHQLLTEAAASHDHVVISGGSLRDGSAASTLAALAGQTVLVVGAGTPERAVTAALRDLREVRAHVLGVTVDRG